MAATRAEIAKASKELARFVSSAGVHKALREANASPSARRAAKLNARKFLAERKVVVPAQYRVSISGTVVICIEVCFEVRGVVICVRVCGTVRF